MKNLSKIELLLVILIIVSIGFILYPIAKKKYNVQKRAKEIKQGQEKLVQNCDLTSIENRIKCFSEQIHTSRSRNKNIKTNYKMIYKKDGKVVTELLKGSDEGTVVQFVRPKNISLQSCVSNTILFDWTSDHFLISPEAINSGAICETTSHGRIALVPDDLSGTELQDFYKLLRKTFD